MNTKLRKVYFILLLIGFGNFCYAVIAPTPIYKEKSAVKKSEQTNKLNSKQSQRFKDRVILKILKNKVKKNRKRTKNSKKISKTALIGFILGLAGLIIPGLGILGLIFSWKALKKFRAGTENRRGKTLAIIGFILSIIGIILSIYLLILVGLFWGL